MKFTRERYQHGSVRKVPRSQGFAWEFRFYLTAQDGKRKLKVQIFDSLKYSTERDVFIAVEPEQKTICCFIHREVVGLSYGAIFGPDVTDVSEWQRIAVEFVDRKAS
jgi:hypothetical protein